MKAYCAMILSSNRFLQFPCATPSEFPNVRWGEEIAP